MNLFTTLAYNGSTTRGISNRIFFGNFCHDFPRFLAHLVATIAKSTVSGWPMHGGSGEFSCLPSVMHFFSSLFFKDKISFAIIA